jgi:pyruvate dehydrogenase complex dehydrogenase (E1) component
VGVFCGDSEMDLPESLGAIYLAGREKSGARQRQEA